LWTIAQASAWASSRRGVVVVAGSDGAEVLGADDLVANVFFRGQVRQGDATVVGCPENSIPPIGAVAVLSPLDLPPCQLFEELGAVLAVMRYGRVSAFGPYLDRC
jgi:hypothetical protein